MSRFGSMSELASLVASEKLVVVSLEELRDVLGYKKLGKHVLAEIARELSGKGLGYFPRGAIDENLEPRKTSTVRVYAKDSKVGKAISAVLEPSDTNDTFLIELTDESDDSAEMLDAIRRIVGV